MYTPSGSGGSARESCCVGGGGYIGWGSCCVCICGYGRDSLYIQET